MCDRPYRGKPQGSDTAARSHGGRTNLQKCTRHCVLSSCFNRRSPARSPCLIFHLPTTSTTSLSQCEVVRTVGLSSATSDLLLALQVHNRTGAPRSRTWQISLATFCFSQGFASSFQCCLLLCAAPTFPRTQEINLCFLYILHLSFVGTDLC